MIAVLIPFILGLLLVLFQLKHFLCDYVFQNSYMLGKFKDKGWVKPLTAHCLVHVLGTNLALIMGLFGILWLVDAKLPLFEVLFILLASSLFDFVAHFVMDRIKASPKLLGRYKALSADEFKRWLSMGDLDDGSGKFPSLTQKGLELRNEAFKSNTYFWWSLGLDQMVHHITHYIIIWFAIYAAFFGI